MEKIYTEITKCRLCKQSELISILHLGDIKLSGIFPKPDEHIDGGPLELVYCTNCSLVQLKQSYNPTSMYGMNYGYKSSLNRSMLTHLFQKVRWLEKLTNAESGDVVLDIGSNDGSMLSMYNPKFKLIGMDPTGVKFKNSYRSDITLVPDFFSAKTFQQHFPEKKPMIITSIAMLYDLEDPVQFFKEVASILHPNGVWHIEQSYLPLMLSENAYDTVCHEHIEYYGLKQIQIMATLANLKIINVDLNRVNGGSFHVTMTHASNSSKTENVPTWISRMEAENNLSNLSTYTTFKENVESSAREIKKLLQDLKEQGKKVFGYGASTKGNVLLQYCGLTKEEIPMFAEVNPDKFGCVTPGTNIPIVSEDEARSHNPDYFIVLPWHFRDNIIGREKEYLMNGGKLIFPLPKLEIVDSSIFNQRNYV